MWTYLPGCAVVALTCPVQWDAETRFTQVKEQLVTTTTELLDVLSAVDEVDSDRLVLYGHSFGAAAAPVILAAMPGAFRCAVLRSGAYNRTLTPAGFQHERRNLWRARDIYDGFTLAYHAEHITTPILLVQGTADANTATTVSQARACYDALRAAGRTARLVLLHNEGHIFHSQDGIIAAAAEERAWINQWTRHAGDASTAHQERRDSPIVLEV
jgi:dipeptidyl aminopeptidase/acylaminoacyl peptidase